MKYRLMSAAALAAMIGCLHSAAVAQDYENPGMVHYHNYAFADEGYRNGQRVVITGTVIRVNDETGRFALRSDGNHRYSVDTYNAEVIAPEAHRDGGEISLGLRVRVVGYRFGIGRVDAERVTVLPDTEIDESETAPAPIAAVAPAPTPAAPAPVDANPMPPVLPAVHADDNIVRLEAVVNAVSADGAQVTVTGADGNVYQVKAHDADIILPAVDRTGTLADLGQGMHVRVIGERVDGAIVADRIRVLRDETVSVTSAAPAAPVVTDLSSYTGIIIDARGFGKIQRSPSPAIYGPDMALLYPDRTHVPNPDEVQDESIVRYYRSEEAAEAGVGGSHPLILEAQTIVGPAEDGVMLSADDAALFKALDQRLQYSRNWKVGFLIPADR